MSKVKITFKLPKETLQHQQTINGPAMSNVLFQTFAYINQQINEQDTDISDHFIKAKKFMKEKMKDEGISFKMPMFD